MTADQEPGVPDVLRAGQLLGQPARDRTGQPLGRLVDLVVDAEPGRSARITHAVVTTGPWGRLLGYESPDERGPWLVSRLAHWVIRRHLRILPWDEVDVDRAR